MESVNGVTVKICDRLKSVPTPVSPHDSNIFGNQILQTSELEYFLTGSGLKKTKTYYTSGASSVFILNDFADLKALIPEARRHVTFKATLTTFKMYRNPYSERDRFKILSQVFDIHEQDSDLDSYIDTILVELTGYSTTNDYRIMSELLLAFSKKFKQ
jgi:hypothetical protein